MVRDGISVCRAGNSTWAIIFGPAIVETGFRLVVPATTEKRIGLVVIDNSARTTNPDVLIDVGQASGAVGAGFVRESEIIIVNLKFSHSIGRAIVTVTVESARFFESIVAHHDAAIIIAVEDAVSAPVESAVLDVIVQKSSGVIGS